MPVIVGMFDNQEDAGDAVDALDALGLEEGAIHVLSRSRLERNGTLFGDLARAFRPGDSAVSQELRSLGVDGEAAEFYDEELDANGILVVAQVGDDDEAAAEQAMERAGASTR